MCVVSMVGGFYQDRWPKQYPWIIPQPYIDNTPLPQSPSQAEFDALKEEVKVMKELLAKAKEYDEKNGEPDCEIEEKMKFLKQVAKAVGVDLDEVLQKKKQDISAIKEAQ